MSSTAENKFVIWYKKSLCLDLKCFKGRGRTTLELDSIAVIQAFDTVFPILFFLTYNCSRVCTHSSTVHLSLCDFKYRSKRSSVIDEKDDFRMESPSFNITFFFERLLFGMKSLHSIVVGTNRRSVVPEAVQNRRRSGSVAWQRLAELPSSWCGLRRPCGPY